MEDKIKKIKEEAHINYIPIINDDSLEFILKIIKEKNPNNILEIGTAVGYSAIMFSKVLKKDTSKILTIEIKEDMYNQAIKNIEAFGLQKQIEVVLEDANVYLKTLNSKFDIIFIDAAKGQYLKYLEEAKRLSKQGSIIIADNVLFKGMVLGNYNKHKHRTAVNKLRQYIAQITTDDYLDTKIYDIGDGIAVSIVK